MIVIGILINIPIAYFQIKKNQLNVDDFAIICGLSAFGGIIGAKALYLFTLREHIDFSQLIDLKYISSLMSGGFVFLGGIVGVLMAIAFCEKKLHISVQPYIQACIGCLPIGHACGRIGCFLVGCCYGIPHKGPLSVVYTHSQFAPCGIALFPIQLVEAFIEFSLGSCLLIFNRRLKAYSGLFLYLMTYSISRFFLEFLRYDEVRGEIVGISTSQMISILLFLYSAFSLNKRCKNPFTSHFPMM